MVRRTKTIGNIGIYRPRVFCMMYGLIGYAFTTFLVEVKGGIVSIQVKLIKSIKSNLKNRLEISRSKKYTKGRVLIKLS